MAMFGAKILNNPEIAKRAKEEFDKSMNGKTYKCPIQMIFQLLKRHEV